MSEGGAAQPGILDSGLVFDLHPFGYDDTRTFIEAGPAALAAAATIVGDRKDAIPIGRVKLLARILNPRRIFCIGLSYRGHAIETAILQK